MRYRISIRQSGFTLIELMTSLVISSIVVLIASGLYAGIVTARDKTLDTSHLFETSFTLSTAVDLFFRQAGFRGIDPTMIGTGNAPPIPSRENFFTSVENQWQAGQFISVSGNTIGLRFGGASNTDGSPDGTIFDCTGSAIGSDTLETITLSVVNSELLCTSSTATEVIAGSDGGAGVEQLVVQLGIDDDQDHSVDRYISGNDATNSDLLAVSAVQLNFLVASAENTLDSPADYWFNGVEHLSDDHKFRKELVLHIALRNY